MPDDSTGSTDHRSNENEFPISGSTTPKSSKIIRHQHDGIVLTRSEEDDFTRDANNISPIMRLLHPKNNASLATSINNDGLHNIEEEGSGGELDTTQNKRKRDSYDNASLLSTDSMAVPSSTLNSAKKLKLIRTGSITRSIRRSMSFVALKNPISTVLRSRRNSSVDPNASIGSITSIESAFNDSIKNPVKEKMRAFRNRIMKSNKRDITPKCNKISGSSTIMRKFELMGDDDGPSTPRGGGSDIADFKTPLAPHPIGSSYYQRISSAKAASSDCTIVDTVKNSTIIVNNDCIGNVGGGGGGGGDVDGNGIDEVGTKFGQPLVELIDNSDVQIVVPNPTANTNAVLIHYFFYYLLVFDNSLCFIWVFHLEAHQTLALKPPPSPPKYPQNENEHNAN